MIGIFHNNEHINKVLVNWLKFHDFTVSSFNGKYISFDFSVFSKEDLNNLQFYLNKFDTLVLNLNHKNFRFVYTIYKNGFFKGKVCLLIDNRAFWDLLEFNIFCPIYEIRNHLGKLTPIHTPVEEVIDILKNTIQRYPFFKYIPHTEITI